MSNMKLEHIDYMWGIMVTIYSNFWTKTLISTLYALYTFFFGVTLVAASKALLALIIIDFCTAFFAVKKSGEVISSAKVFRTPLKILVYFMLVSAAHLMETASPLLGFLDETMLGFLALTELISILENTGKMGYVVPQKMLNRLRELRDDK